MRSQAGSPGFMFMSATSNGATDSGQTMPFYFMPTLGGNDTLRGFGGADRFDFTTALGAGNVDLIVDMTSGVDKIGLEDAIFTAIGASLDANEFVIGAAAGDADDRIIYNQATGQLFYDADGNGAGAAVLFATLQNAPAITVTDFTVF